MRAVSVLRWAPSTSTPNGPSFAEVTLTPERHADHGWVIWRNGQPIAVGDTNSEGWMSYELTAKTPAGGAARKQKVHRKRSPK